MGLIQHMRRRHSDKRTQPVTCYQQMRSKNRYTLGFYCNHCEEASNTYQRMRQHCESEHDMRYQYTCTHCKVGNAGERALIGHVTEAHAGQPGLAVQQFERVANELLDSHNWELAKEISKHIENTAIATGGGEVAEDAEPVEPEPKPVDDEVEVIDDGEQPIETIELVLSSDEEEESDEQQCQMVPSCIDGQVSLSLYLYRSVYLWYLLCLVENHRIRLLALPRDQQQCQRAAHQALGPQASRETILLHCTAAVMLPTVLWLCGQFQDAVGGAFTQGA